MLSGGKKGYVYIRWGEKKHGYAVDGGIIAPGAFLEDKLLICFQIFKNIYTLSSSNSTFRNMS